MPLAPLDAPLQDFANVCEVLEAFRDAIKAHWKLFKHRKILHRDVSHGNIILTSPDQNGGCSGMLIDYDLAVQIGADGKSETSGEKNMTGTLDFMAIEILEGAVRKETAGIDHTYRHDLESFFYVFLALCIRHGWGEDAKPKRDILRNWYDECLGAVRPRSVEDPQLHLHAKDNKPVDEPSCRLCRRHVSHVSGQLGKFLFPYFRI